MVALRSFVPTDAQLLTEMYRKSAEAEGIDPYSTLQKLPTAKDFELRAQQPAFLVAEANGAVVGAADMRWWKEADLHVYLLNGVVDPQHRSNGIGTAMLHELETRARAFHEQNGGTQAAAFGANASSTNTGSQLLLLDNGYTKVFGMVEMQSNVATADFENTKRPDLDVRRVRREDLPHLQRLNATVYSDRPFAVIDENESIDEFVGKATDLTLWTAAWRDNEPIAFVIAVERDGFAEVTEVSVHPSHRRRGIAKHLLTSTLQTLEYRNHSVVRLHTNAEDVSGARSLYEQLGFTEVRTHFRYRKQLST